MLFAFRNTKKRWWCALCSNTREYMYYLLYFISFTLSEKTSKSCSESQTQTSEYQISCSKVLLWSHKKLAMELFWLRSDWKTGFSLMHFLFVERCSLKIKKQSLRTGTIISFIRIPIIQRRSMHMHIYYYYGHVLLLRRFLHSRLEIENSFDHF